MVSKTLTKNMTKTRKTIFQLHQPSDTTHHTSKSILVLLNEPPCHHVAVAHGLHLVHPPRVQQLVVPAKQVVEEMHHHPRIHLLTHVGELNDVRKKNRHLQAGRQRQGASARACVRARA